MDKRVFKVILTAFFFIVGITLFVLKIVIGTDESSITGESINESIQTYSSSESLVSSKEPSTESLKATIAPTTSTIGIKDYTSGEPIAESEITPEIYDENDSYSVYVYFTNTELIDKADFLPMEAQTILCKQAQVYLNRNGYNEARELKVLDETVYHDEEKAVFDVIVSPYNVQIKIEYNYETGELIFSKKID